MENNFLLYFFAFAFLIAWSGVVVCSVYSFIRSMKKDIENHSPQINKRGVEYDDKLAYLAIYHIDKNKITFIPKDCISRIYINAEDGFMTATADDKDYVTYDGSIFFYVSEAQVDEYFNEYRHTKAGLKSWLAFKVGIGYFACMSENNEFRQMYEREAITGFKKSKK